METCRYSFPNFIFNTCFLITSGPKVETGRQEYMVQFNDDISFVEIYDKYDVIEQRGDIWTIQDKEIK